LVFPVQRAVSALSNGVLILNIATVPFLLSGRESWCAREQRANACSRALLSRSLRVGVRAWTARKMCGVLGGSQVLP